MCCFFVDDTSIDDDCILVDMAVFPAVASGCVCYPSLEAYVAKVSEVEAEFYSRT